MGVDSGVLWVADFENDLRFQVRRPNRRQRVNRRPPSRLNSKKMIDMSSWMSILGFSGSLISIMTLDFRSVVPSAV